VAEAEQRRLERIYERWAQGDFSASVDAFADDVVLVMDQDLPDSGRYEGVEAIRGYTRHFLEPWESIAIEAESFEEHGDRFLVAVRQSGVGRDSGVPTEMRYFHVWAFRDGAVIRLFSIRSEPKAREVLAG
jgi:ketosteroid isomerase-like protein